MTTDQIITATNAVAEQLLADRATPMTHPVMVQGLAAVAALQAATKLREIPQRSVVYLVADQGMIEVTYDALQGVYRASRYDEQVA